MRTYSAFSRHRCCKTGASIEKKSSGNVEAVDRTFLYIGNDRSTSTLVIVAYFMFELGHLRNTMARRLTSQSPWRTDATFSIAFKSGFCSITDLSLMNSIAPWSPGTDRIDSTTSVTNRICSTIVKPWLSNFWIRPGRNEKWAAINDRSLRNCRSPNASCAYWMGIASSASNPFITCSL